VIDKLDYCSRPANWNPGLARAPRFTFIKGDILDTQHVLEILEEHEIETVIHFAAQTHVDNSFCNVTDFIRDNIEGTNNLLRACHLWGKIKRFLHISTDEVYGEVPFEQKEGCKETDPLRPTNPYAASKAGAEHIACSYAKSFGLPIIITRANNVYGSLRGEGAHQYPEKLIPKFSLMLLRGQKLTIHGEGRARRNFIHAEDICRALETILQRGEIGEIYNIGTTCEYSVLEVAEKLLRVIHGKAAKLEDHLAYVEDRHFNDCRYHLDSSKLRALGWEEEVDFDEGLSETAAWFHSHEKEFGPVF